MKNFKKGALYWSVLAVFLLSFFFVGVHKANAVAISPGIYYVKSNGIGRTLHDELIIFGKTEYTESFKVYLYTVNMEFIGEDGDRTFSTPTAEDLSEPGNWIELSQSEVTVVPGQDTKIPWKITPTAEAKCGTNHAAIIVASNPRESEEEGAKVSISSEVVAQVNIDIGTNHHQDCADNEVNLSLVEFIVNKRFPIFNYDQVPFLTKLENKGNLILTAPGGYIEIFGLGEKITISFNPENLNVYPETVRKFDDMWTDEEYPREGSFWDKFFYELMHLRIGKYSAQLGVTKNVDSQIVATDTFWIIPWRVILVLLVIILGLAWFFSFMGSKPWKKKEGKNN